MPKWNLIAMAMLMAALAGCQSQEASDRPIRLRLAHVYEVKAPTHAFGAAFLSERMAEADVGLEVTVFPTAQLGSEAELLEQLVAGELELAIAGPAFLAMWHPPIGVLDAAYAFRDLDHALEVAQGEIAQPLWEELRRSYGVRVLDSWAYGSRHLTSKRPIRHPDDLHQFRLRLPDAKIWQASGESLGASPTPIPFSEVYMALQQGIADGQENPIPTIQAMGFHEVQSHLNLTGHIQSSVQVLVNERVWQRLSPIQQEALQTVIRQLGEEVHQGIVRDEERILEQWRESGAMQVVEDVDVEAFRQRASAYFSTGFPFSEVYRTIAESVAPPQERDEKARVPETVLPAREKARR